MLFNVGWYAGHHVPAYSMLAPPLFALLGPQLVGALSMVGASLAFDRLARERLGAGAAAASWWFAAGSVTVLLSGRLTFALGLGLALAAALAASRGRRALAPALAALTALASPVAGGFLALAAAAWGIHAAHAASGVENVRSRLTFSTVDVRAAAPAGVLAGAAVTPALALGVAFPEGGTFPFVAGAFLPALAVGVLLVVLTSGAVRVGALLYVTLLVVAVGVPSPMGGNATRLGAAFAGPLIAAALWPRRRVLLAVLAPGLVAAQWVTPIDDVSRAAGDPSTKSEFYAPLLERLRAEDAPLRVEVPFTDQHAEAFFLGREVPLARGWLRQVDRDVNAVLYRDDLGAPAYGRWLRDTAVTHVALADAPIDYSGAREAAIVRAGHPMLEEIWRGGAWRLFAVRGGLAPPGGDADEVEVGRSGVVRVRWTPYWRLEGARGCVSRAGDWTRVDLDRPGRLVTTFAPGRVRATSPRCTR